MSEQKKLKLKCPKCGKEFETDMWVEINADTDPELRNQILSRELFKIECPECKTIFNLQYPLLYISPVKRYVVLLTDRYNEEIEKEFETRTSQYAIMNYTRRITGSINDFAEKILIFDGGFSDVAFEFIKSRLYLDGTKKGYKIKNMYYAGLKDIVTAIFQFVGPEQKGNIEVPLDQFEAAVRQLPKDLNGYVVNPKTLSQWLQEHAPQKPTTTTPTN